MITEPGVAAANPKIVDRIRATPNPRLPFSCSFRSQCAEDWVTCASVDADQDNGHGSAVTQIYCATAGLKGGALLLKELFAAPGDKVAQANGQGRDCENAERAQENELGWTSSQGRVQVSNWSQYSSPAANTMFLASREPCQYPLARQVKEE